jgi:hypothetical protein
VSVTVPLIPVAAAEEANASDQATARSAGTMARPAIPLLPDLLRGDVGIST